MPWINWLLMVSVLTLVFAFRSSAALAFAFGMAVTGTITITTLLFFYVARVHWRTPLWLVGIGAGVLLAVDLLFLAANLTKLVHGAWLPLLIGITVFTVMTTWQRGRELVTAEREQDEGSLQEFVDRAARAASRRCSGCPGTAVFLNRGKQTAPLAMRANVEHNHVLHEHVVIMSIETEPVPRVPAERADRRSTISATPTTASPTSPPGSATWRHRTCPPPAAARPGGRPKVRLELDQASYFLSTIELRGGDAPTMAPWRKRLFIATSYITADAAEYFRLPRDRTLIMGSHIEV